jgi:ABC-2 type transport system ATP-binding protein
MVMATTKAISLDELGKQYGTLTALRHVAFDVEPNEVFGFLGVNGAGKTTTIRILLDLVRPTAGRAAIFGVDCQTRGPQVRSQIGYLPAEFGFYPDMTGASTLELLGKLTSRTIDVAWRNQLLDRLQLASSDLRRRIREYSTGMKRKLAMVQALQADPPLLVLDEPTEGLDPLMQDAFYEIVAELRRRGRTVFMSSHVLPEVERVCDRIAVLRRGELALISTVDEIRRLAARRVRVLFGADVEAPVRWPDGWQAIDVRARAWSLRVRGPLGPLMPMIAPLQVVDVEVDEPHFDDVLRSYYGDSATS